MSAWREGGEVLDLREGELLGNEQGFEREGGLLGKGWFYWIPGSRRNGGRGGAWGREQGEKFILRCT